MLIALGVVVALGWAALVIVTAYRLHLWQRTREWTADTRAGSGLAFCLAGVIWGIAFNVALLPALIVAAAS